MATADGVRWLTITHVARLTGLSDETIRKYCIATPKVHFPSARLVDDRWEIPEDEARAAKIIDRSFVVARTGLTESRLTQLERLEKLTCSAEGKFSLDQEVYLHRVRGLEDLASAPAFQERGARGPANGLDSVSPEAAQQTATSAAATLALQPSGPPTHGADRERPREIVVVRAGIPLWAEFLAYMTDHKDPARLPDEFFAGEYAPEFIAPVDTEYYVALGPALDENREPFNTWVRRYMRWTYDGKNLKAEEEVEFQVEGQYRRGSVPDQYAEASAKYGLLRGLWTARAAEARARLRERARTMGGISLPERVWGLDVRSWIARYQTEKLHPSVFPDSVKVGLVDVPFIPTYDMFLYESTGEVRLDAHGNEYTVMRVTPGFSEDDGFKQFDGRPLEPLPLWLMWHGRHAEGEVRPYEVAESAEYMVWEQAWEEMQREGRRLKAQRNGQ